MTGEDSDTTNHHIEYTEYTDSDGYKPPITHLNDPRNKLSYWYPRLRNNPSIPVPETRFHSLTSDENANGLFDKWDTDSIRKLIEAVGGDAFIRTEYKSAIGRVGDFAPVTPTTPEDRLNEYLGVLLTNTVSQADFSSGDALAIREYLDLDYSPYTRDTLHPELRFFIQNGDVKYHYLQTTREQFTDAVGSDKLYDQMLDRIDVVIDDIKEYAETAASEFSDAAWSVDFVITTEFDVYCTDMALDGLQYNRRTEEWMNISAHSSGSPFSFEAQYADQLPAAETLENPPSTYTVSDLLEI